MVEADWFLAVAFPDNQTQMLPYNRMVKDLAGHTPDAFLAAVKAVFAVREGGPAAPARKGDVAMYFGGKWYTLDISARRPATDVDQPASTSASCRITCWTRS